ncbi:MAG: hypothetical protein ACRD4M_10140 [Candidatus Acidiferrales bacterium]
MAQSNTGSIVGIITDPQGRAIPGATVVATDASTAIAWKRPPA